MDFRVLYPEVAENLFMKLTPAILEKLIKYSDLQGIKWRMYLGTEPALMESG